MEKVYYSELQRPFSNPRGLCFLVSDRPANSKPDFICLAANQQRAQAENPNHEFRNILNITRVEYVVGFKKNIN